MSRRVHIISPDDWQGIVPYLSRQLKDGLAQFCEVTLSTQPERSADLNYFATWHPRDYPDMSDWGIPSVAMFTHLNTRDPGWYKGAIAKPDYVVAQSNHGRNILIENGRDPKTITVIYPGNEEFVVPRGNNTTGKVIVGISGRLYDNGRKREWLPLELAWGMSKEVMDKVHWLIAGEWWDFQVERMYTYGLSVQYAPRTLSDKSVRFDYDKYPQIFSYFDLYLCTSFVEGGPMGALQALATGTPVISPNYGYCSDFAGADSQGRERVIHYAAIEELAGKLEKFIESPYRVDPVVIPWENWGKEHLALFERIWAKT